MEAPISKAEFARRRGVSAGRVSQWISEGKLTGPALTDGEGRDQKVWESVACQQLRMRLDSAQLTGNGLDTNLAPSTQPQSADAGLPLEQPPAPPTAPGSMPPRNSDPGGADDVNEKIKAQRLEQLERQNRNERREELIAAGQLTEASSIRQMVGRELARFMVEFDGALASIATNLSAEFKLPQRDVLHFLRGQFRTFRADQAKAARERSTALPEIATFDDEPADAPSLEAAE